MMPECLLFDIDGADHLFCPAVGTPVRGVAKKRSKPSTL